MKAWWALSLMVGFAMPVRMAFAVDYERDIKPLFSQKCGACHGALKQESGLRLDAGVLIRKGSDEGPVIVPGKAAESSLLSRVTSEDADDRMPPQGTGSRLNAKQIALISAWIDAGALVPQDEAIPNDPRAHWAYRVPKRPELPEPADKAWSHPIDRFIEQEHRRLGLQPVELADRHTLFRRVYLDLIGLPPTRQQIADFVQDDSNGAWEKTVDALLKSPHHGERWGRHWMDVWRYSDWDGYKNQLRGSQRHIWRWRDWIVESLNADKGYDRMIVEMLAADEVAPTDPSVLPATGFLGRNFHNANRNMWLDATVEHTAKAFLGLTLNCTRCHDHKFDPIPQTAYYKFRAIFEPHNVRTDRIPGESDLVKAGLPRAFDADLDVKTFRYIRGNEKHPDKENPVTPAVPAVLGGNFEIKPVDLPVEAYYPAIKDFVRSENLTAAKKELAELEKLTEGSLLQQKRKVAALRVQSLEARQAADLAKYSEVTEKTKKSLAIAAAKVDRNFKFHEATLKVVQQTAALKSVESSAEKNQNKKQKAISAAKKELAEVEKKLKAAEAELKKTDGGYSPLGKQYPRTSSGRRLALARWIVAPENPLAARVAVNHIWLRHFGSPLVNNVFDFGLRSPQPRHVKLLDWLAVELMENNWSMKHLHRLIVTSRTWRLSSSANESLGAKNRSIDGDNLALWQMKPRRLDAEIIRDSVLAVSGQLDTTLGGPDIDYLQGETSQRRSIYLRHAYEKQMTMLVLFDAASPNECYRRSETVIPQQALALTNSSLALGQSRLLARKLWKEVSTSGNEAKSKFVHAAFLETLSRPPAEEELAACLQFLTRQTALLGDVSKLSTFPSGDEPKIKPAADPQKRALENLVHVLINHNDFVTVR